MNTIRVGVVGYGTIGKRIADAIVAQPDMRLAGVSIRNPNPSVLSAVWSDVRLYAEAEYVAGILEAGLPLAGHFPDLLRAVDVIVDCTQRGEGKRRIPEYARAGVPVI